jgi:hypothetical protein
MTHNYHHIFKEYDVDLLVIFLSPLHFFKKLVVFAIFKKFKKAKHLNYVFPLIVRL